VCTLETEEIVRETNLQPTGASGTEIFFFTNSNEILFPNFESCLNATNVMMVMMKHMMFCVFSAFFICFNTAYCAALTLLFRKNAYILVQREHFGFLCHSEEKIEIILMISLLILSDKIIC